MARREELTNEQWALIEPFFDRPPIVVTRGRSRHAEREVLNGVLWIAEEMCDSLHRSGFVYKKTKQIAMKVNEIAQSEFVEKFEKLQTIKEADEVHYFIDAVHQTLNSKTSYGWIEKGQKHQVLSNSGCTRTNILGALHAKNITDIFKKEYKKYWKTDFTEQPNILEPK
jgi:hypothetical protein